jgi:hypothetical protein
MRFANKAVLAAGLGFTVSAVVGCGSGGNLLSSDQATQLRAQLRLASAALSAGECGSAERDISSFQKQVDDLGSVNQTLVNNLQAGATKVERLATNECAGSTTTSTPPPKPKPTHTTPPKTTPTVTTVTETQPTTSSPVTTSTSTGTTTGQTTTGQYTSSTPTDTAPPPGTGLTGQTTTGTPTSSTQSVTQPSSGGTGLNGAAGDENTQNRGFVGGSQRPPGWQRHQQYPGSNGWRGGHGGWQVQGDGS